MKQVSAVIAGVLFGMGLAVSGMSDPANVLAFLVIGTDWNPALIGTMGAAVVVTTVGYALTRRRGRPLFEVEFSMPTAESIDARLLAGAALFGAGWGLSGYCPGPGLVGLAVLDLRALAFVPSFVVGMALFEVFARPRSSRQLASDG